MNTWPCGNRRAMSQSEHEAWNYRNYPGTCQLCHKCEQPTGRCEEDSMCDEDGNAPCETCIKECENDDAGSSTDGNATL